MAELAFPLEGHVYSAREAGLWFATRTSGVHASDSLAVTNGGGMSVSVGSGVAWLKYAEFTGAAYANTAAKIMAIEAADNTLPRIDRVVVRYSNTYNNIALAVVKGTPASTPAPPDITRDSLTYEISLARVRVNAGVKAITAYDITDERMDNTVCGLMTDGVTPFDPEMGGIIVDDTLTIEGAAADAKAVGDAIEETNGKINKKALEILQSRAAAVHAENHHCTDTITWDGSTEGRTVVERLYPEDNFAEYCVLISETDITPESLANGYHAGVFLAEDTSDFAAKNTYETYEGGGIVIMTEYYGEFIDEPDMEFGLAFYAPYDGYTFNFTDEDESLTLPKKGLYFVKDVIEGNLYLCTNSLTIPGYAFETGSDPVTPEMISAAPTLHTSRDARHGMATEELFGHVRAFAKMPSVDENGDIIAAPDGRALMYGTNSGYVMDLACWMAFYNLLNVQLTYMENDLYEALYRIEELESKVKALGG